MPSSVRLTHQVPLSGFIRISSDDVKVLTRILWSRTDYSCIFRRCPMITKEGYCYYFHSHYDFCTQGFNPHLYMDFHHVMFAVWTLSRSWLSFYWWYYFDETSRYIPPVIKEKALDHRCKVSTLEILRRLACILRLGVEPRYDFRRTYKQAAWVNSHTRR